MRHDGYFAAFVQAVEKSVKWGLLASGTPRKAPEAGRALDHLPLVGKMLSSLPLDDQQIRLSCGQIHTWLFKNLVARGVRCILTVGDVLEGGKREYETSYQRLKQELRGVHRDGDEPYPFHVWLTFPDMHIVDANFYIYKHYDELPDRWSWADYVICSEHPFSQKLDLEYLPMLAGDDLVDRMIFERIQ